MGLVNFLLIGFLGFMVYWWLAQGLFSALLHLISVIIAGALAFALWEPLVMGLLMKWDNCGTYAWGLGLIVPFIAFLLIVRQGFDKLVRKNVNFSPVISMVGGGGLGLLAGLLTAGLTAISLNFMPVGVTFGGYQPLQYQGGKIIEKSGGDLWVGVDRMAASFFSKLSVGAFSSGRPLRDYQPQLARRAALYRTHLDENASLAALPGTVSVDAVYAAPTPIAGATDARVQALGNDVSTPGSKLVIVDTTWNRTRRGTYDRDQVLRVASTQIRLVTKGPGYDAQMNIHAPLAASKVTQAGGLRQLVLFNDDQTYATGANQSDSFGWVFLVPETETLEYVFLRQLRMRLPAPNQDPAMLFAAIGVAAPPPAPPPPPKVGTMAGHTPGSSASDILITSNLPARVSASAVPSALRINDKGEIMSGKGTVNRPTGGNAGKVFIDRLNVPSPNLKAMVRVELTQDRAQSLLGAALAAAVSLHGAFLKDSSGNELMPIAYVWDKRHALEIVVSFDQPFQSSRNLPVRQMGKDDRIYLYYLANRGTRIEKFHVGPTTQMINLDVP